MIKIWLYLASKADDKSMDDIIALWTKPWNKKTPPYSHVEWERTGGVGRWLFSSTLRGKWKGTRFAPAGKVLKHPERWHCLQKKFTMEEENEMTIRARNINHRPYAKAGVVLSFLLPFGWLGTGLAKLFNHWYCSMAVLYVITGKKKRISPRRLSKWALKNGFVWGR